MGKLTLCDAVLIGDIPRYKFDAFNELEELVSYWLESKKNTVFVCFQSWKDAKYQEEHQRIVVTHSKEDIENWELLYIESIDISEIDFSIFEFSTYEEAFKYSLDLKEGL